MFWPTGQSLPQVALWFASSSDVIGYINLRVGGDGGVHNREGESRKKEKKQEVEGGGR